jgi:predicted permease
MAAALYRLLLRFYPASFRAEYGREMAGVFLRRYGLQQTAAGRAGFWLTTLADVLSNASAIHSEILRQDLRGAVRSLARTPGFSVAVMLVAALGIGATTAAFSLADHVLIRPLPFPEPDRLVKLWQDQSAFGYTRMEMSPPNFRDWRRESASFDGMAAYQGTSLFFPDPSGSAARVDGASTIGDVFAVLRLRPALGRSIGDDDDRSGAPAVIILSDGLWRSRFNADPGIVGQTIAFAETPRTVIGVMPPAVGFPNRNTRFWIPQQLRPAAYADDQRANFIFNVIGRLKPGVSIDAARAELKVIAERLAAAFPTTNAKSGAVVITLRDDLTPQARLLLWGLVAAAVALLLIACTNLANLLLSRSLSRQREFAVRAALGAGRHRLVRQMLTETLTLAGVGGALGIVLAVVVVPFVARLVPTNLPIEETPPLDLRMITAAIVATLATAAGVGVIPAFRIGRHLAASALREGARVGTSRRTERTRSALVVAEIAASIALLVCTGLLVRALLKVQQTEPGFRADGILTIRTNLPTSLQTSLYRNTERRLQFYDRVLSDVRALPGVTSASYITWLPMVMRGGIWPVSVDGKVEDESSAQRASFRQVMPGFFATMETPLMRGRDFDERDTAESPLAAIVSESFVRRFWPDRDPLGRLLSLGGRERVVVGVAGNIRVRGLERDSEPQVYIPAAQGGAYSGYYPRELVVRISVPPVSLTGPIRAVVARADPQMPIADVRTLREVVDGETAPRRVQVNVLASFAAIAFLLAAIGLHGLLSFNVSSRAREIGVRIALGARRQTIVAMIVKDAALLAVAGVVLGAGLAFTAGRAMQALLAGVSPTDPLTFAGAVALSVLMTLAGTLLPTLRALGVDPIAVIRTE